MSPAVLSSLTRRELLVASVLAPFGVSAAQRSTATTPVPSAAIGPPPYKISINMELMFRATNPFPRRSYPRNSRQGIHRVQFLERHLQRSEQPCCKRKKRQDSRV
jgi:hypothetical protein